MSEFIDRLAKVLNREIGSFFGPEECRAPVRAILTEMRDAVTEEMILEGAVESNAQSTFAVRRGFQAMIETALKEGQ